MPVLDFIGTVVLTAVMVVNVNAVISSMEVPRTNRLVMATIAGLWIGLQVALASAGAYATGAPYIGTGVITPLAAAAIAFSVSPGFRTALLNVPTPLLVGLNFNRILGAFFLLLAASGRLAGPFPVSAGWGDIITGLIALPLAVSIARGNVGRGSILLWNAFGTLDLVVAVVLGILSANGSLLHLIEAGVGSAAIAHLPWSLIPTVIVPFYLIVHAVIFMQQRETATGHVGGAQAA